MKIVKVNYNGEKITKKKLFCNCDHDYPGGHKKTKRGYVDLPITLANDACKVCGNTYWLYTKEDQFPYGEIRVIEEVSV